MTDIGLLAVEARIDQLLAWVRDAHEKGTLPDVLTLGGVIASRAPDTSDEVKVEALALMLAVVMLRMVNETSATNTFFHASGWEDGFYEASEGIRGLLATATDNLRRAFTAFAIDCVENGDMTPGAKRMLDSILHQHLGEGET